MRVSSGRFTWWEKRNCPAARSGHKRKSVQKRERRPAVPQGALVAYVWIPRGYEPVALATVCSCEPVALAALPRVPACCGGSASPCSPSGRRPVDVCVRTPAPGNKVAPAPYGAVWIFSSDAAAISGLIRRTRRTGVRSSSWITISFTGTCWSWWDYGDRPCAGGRGPDVRVPPGPGSARRRLETRTVRTGARDRGAGAGARGPGT